MLGVFKMMLLCLVFGVCSILGILKAKSYDSRVEELKKVKNALEMLKSKIEFTYAPIRDIFEEVTDTIYTGKENIFQNTVCQMDKTGVANAWNLAVEKEEKLTNEDKSTLKLFGKLLGKTDKAGQINEIQVASTLLDTQIEKAEQEKQKNYKLFKTLGSVVGIGICIMLV